jgi:hypothetical protein
VILKDRASFFTFFFKRCYDNILSECGITDPLQIYSGWLDEHEHDHGMQFWPPNVLTDITQFLLAHGDVALTNDMLKVYKVGKAYDCPSLVAIPSVII